MKILIATDTYYPIVNGASYAAQRLAQWLQRSGHKVLVVAPSRSFVNETFVYNGVPIQGVSSFPIERIRVAIPIIATQQIKKAMNDFQPDIVHIQMHFFIARQVAKISKKMGIPIVGTNHFMPENLIHFIPLPKSLHDFVKRMAWGDFFKIFNTLNAVTSPTKAGAALLREVGFKKAITVISNGVDTSRFRPVKKDARPILLFVGRIDKEKNLDVVIRGFAKVAGQGGMCFTIVGTGAEKKRLERLVLELGIANVVTFAGFVPDEDLPRLYANAACFIIGGTAELQSIATMEAMASGLPIIAADAVALPELVQHNENGLLFKPGDAAGIAEAIEKMFASGSLRKNMGKKSLELIKVHDIRKVIKQYEALYRKVITTQTA